MNSCIESVAGSETASHLQPPPSVAGTLIRLQRERYDGLCVVRSSALTTAFVFHQGAVVFAEDHAGGEPFSQRLVTDGHISSEAFARAVSIATESLTECQDLTLTVTCRALDLVADDTMRRLVQDRVRARLIQVVGQQDGDIAYEPLDELPELAEGWGQPPAPQVYLGVRTFFGEADLAQTRQVLSEQFARPLAAAEAVGVQLALEPQERSLVAALAATQPVAQTVAASRLEALHAWQLVTLLWHGEYCLFSEPCVSEGNEEQSVVRERTSLVPPARPSPSSAASRRSSCGGVRAPKPGPTCAPLGEPQTPRPRVRRPRSSPMPSAKEHRRPRPAADDRFPDTLPEVVVPAAESPARLSVADERLADTLPEVTVPVAEPSARSSVADERLPDTLPEVEIPAAEPSARNSGERRTLAHPSSGPLASPSPPLASVRERPSAQVRSGQASAPEPTRATPETSEDKGRRAPAGSPAASNEAPGTKAPGRSARARPRREPQDRRAALSALGRLGRELRRRRPNEPPPAAPPAANPAPDASGYGEAHLKHLIRMRVAGAMRQQGETKRASDDLYHQGRALLQAEAFDRAAELFGQLTAEEPEQPVFEAYRLYALLRAHPKADTQAETITRLRGILRDYLSDDEHRAFAYYALGHAAFAEDNDATAEKLFRRATELNKKNKDAVRYLKILERRREQPARPQKLFGIELSASVGSRRNKS